MAGEFAKLLPFTWRGKHYPVTYVNFAIAHDLVEHKYWGVDGGRVEDTGIAPVRIDVRIPIANSIYPAPNEKWVAGSLWPFSLRDFFLDFGKRATGLVGHPEWGEIACKCEKASFVLQGDRQDSTEIAASWVETLDDEVVSKVVTSPIQDMELAATNLDANLEDENVAALLAQIPERPQFKEDFATLARRIRGAIDQVSVLSYRAAGMVNQITYQARAMKGAVERVKDARLWPVTNDLNRVQAAGYALRKKTLTPTGIGLYTVPADTTLAGVAIALPKGTRLTEVIKMNPNLVRDPVVRKDSVVRYPLAA